MTISNAVSRRMHPLQDAENQSLNRHDSISPTDAETRAKEHNSLFLNDRGLRAGWRFILFLALVRLVLIPLVFALAKPFRHRLESSVGDASDVLLLVCVLLGTYIMSKIERRSVLSYGLRDSLSLPHFFVGGL